jgi:hypothetical protein
VCQNRAKKYLIVNSEHNLAGNWRHLVGFQSFYIMETITKTLGKLKNRSVKEWGLSRTKKDSQINITDVTTLWIT